jgi:hypothetical protein
MSELPAEPPAEPPAQTPAQTPAKPPAKRGRGRPTCYEPKFADQAAKLCDLGATDLEIANFFGVHYTTIYEWKHVHPAFCDAIRVGKARADERVERSLYQKAIGYTVTEQTAMKYKPAQHREAVKVVSNERHVPAETGAATFWLRNRQPERWRERSEMDVAVLDLAAVIAARRRQVAEGREEEGMISAFPEEAPAIMPSLPPAEEGDDGPELDPGN